MNISKELIDIVHESGADAAKFIFWFPEEIMSDKSTVYEYQTSQGKKSENMFEMLSKLTFTLEQWHELKEYADKKNVILFSTVNSPSGIEYAKAINLDAFKLSSWDFNYPELWEDIAKLKKPMLIDTGPATTIEVMRTIDIVKKYGCEYLLVHCFHTDNYEEKNMRSIPYMRNTFNCNVGFSSTDQNEEMDIIAIALGASYIEKRLTLSRTLPGHHHILSLEPKEFKSYVKRMREIQESLGQNAIIPSQDDLKERKRFFRSLTLTKDIQPGTVLTTDMFASKRPGFGVSPENVEMFLGKKINKALKKDELIKLDDVEG